MITAVGVGTDPTIQHFCATARELGAAVRLVDLINVVAGGWEFHLPADNASWVAADAAARIELDPHGAFFCRLIDLGPVYPTSTIAWATAIAGFASWLELCPGNVVNRPGHANDNASKPLHEARLVAADFAVPPSVTACSRDVLTRFTAEGLTIAKAISGQRTDCRVVSLEDFDDYDERSGPVHLQRYVEGDDVRAHVVGDEVVSVRIVSEATDYRTDSGATFEKYSLPPEVEYRLRTASRAFGLAFAGWDLRVAADVYWALEANPMPGYSYYDMRLDGRITRAILDYFAAYERGGMQ
jgi:hypothetical protein